MNVQAGELNQRIDVHSQSRTPDGAGGFTNRQWVKVATLFASVRPLTGNERMAADRIEASGGYHVIVRTRMDLNESQSLVWSGRRHNIRWVKARAPRSLYQEIETDLGVAV